MQKDRQIQMGSIAWQERTLNETVVTFAHEVAHSFNASHDDDLVKDHPECDGSFIMSSSYDPEACEYQSSIVFTRQLRDSKWKKTSRGIWRVP